MLRLANVRGLRIAATVPPSTRSSSRTELTGCRRCTSSGTVGVPVGVVASVYAVGGSSPRR